MLIFLCFCNPKNAPQKIFFKCLAPTKKKKKEKKNKAHDLFGPTKYAFGIDESC